MLAEAGIFGLTEVAKTPLQKQLHHGQARGVFALLFLAQAENDDPQPQDFEEFGLMKLKPCFISDSS